MTKRLPLGLALRLWDRTTTWDEVVEIVRFADELGYDQVSVTESFGRDGFTLADRLLHATQNIKVCVGIANVFSRSPALLAMTAATLDEASGGRFVLGLGASTPNLVQGLHGLAFEKPMQRMRETIELARRVWARDASPYEGEIFNTGGVKLGFAPVRDQIPIWMGSLLPKSLALCGELADGWTPTMSPKNCLGPGAERIAAGAARTGRDPKAVTVAPNLQVSVGDPNDVLAQLKFSVAIYYGPPNSPYAKAAIGLGFQDEVVAIQKAYAEGGSKAAAAATDDRLALSIAITGSEVECRAEISSLLQAESDQILVAMPAPTRAECEPILEGIIPEQYRQ